MALISTGKAARIAGVTRETIQNRIKRGELKAVQMPSGHYRLEEKDIRDTLLCKPDLSAMLA